MAGTRGGRAGGKDYTEVAVSQERARTFQGGDKTKGSTVQCWTGDRERESDSHNLQSPQVYPLWQE